jgi:predicted TIM-barrel fold metal-dependent hydrolase
MKTIHGAWNDSPDAVTLIDAHHHLWDLSQKKHPNLIGEPRHDFFMGDDSALRRNYLPEDYKRDAAGHNVLTTVHCEAERDRGGQVGETRWITQINAEYGFPGAIVAHAWFDTDNAEEIIAAQAAFPLVRCIRSKPVTASSPDRVEPGAPGTMQDERWLRGFALLENYGPSWDLRLPFWHLGEAAAVARAFPNIAIVLNHTGFLWDRSDSGNDIQSAARKLLIAAAQHAPSRFTWGQLVDWISAAAGAPPNRQRGLHCSYRPEPTRRS